MTDGFNWVKARAECSLGKVFEELKAEVRSDVDTRDELLANTALRSQCKFRFNSKDRSFTAILDGNNLHRTVEFTLENGEIFARSDGNILWRATVGLNHEGQCVLRIDDEDCEHWQARKMALEQLFFSELPAPDPFSAFGGHRF